MKMKKIVCTVVQCFLIIGMMCASLPLPLQASASTTDSMPLENGIYYIKNLNCNKYLDLKPGVAAQMFAFNGTACQQWKVSGSNGVYTITSVYNDKALDARYVTGATYPEVWDFTPNGTACQQWIISQNSDGSFRITSAYKTTDSMGYSASTQHADMSHHSSADNSKRWTFQKPAAHGVQEYVTYYFKNIATGKYMDVDGGDQNGNNIQLWDYNGTVCQKFRIYKEDTGSSLIGNTYQIEPECSFSRMLNVSGTNINILNSDSSSNQKFELVRDNTMQYGGLYYIKNGSKYVVGNQSTDNVELSNYNGLNSLWSLETVDRHDSDLFCFSEFGIGISGTCYSDYVGAMGYLPYYHTDASRDTAFDYLQTASMWIHNGHGAPGIAAFMNGQRITATNIHALPHNELGGLRCFITMGCEGGSTDSNGLNLVKAAYYRGAKFALGFEHTQYTGVVDTWLVRFLERSSQGKNIQTSLQYADLVANLPYFGTGVKYYLGDTYQCLSR